ncbi:DUF2087 domain-containing protein [Loktanella sp. D2R18]|uniref:DUF2087 domain-containing protein n=1 Tax=Rhodobacterales TaxID=204455 RepID=UPI000DEBA9F4|nr:MULTISPECIES: DUF2087 domain-containing protein [Rhodobacterales]MDO6590635.1 DUF2087 domain-containing protein [Yoonia sp. 1_MG-2023]RBW44739.1 DUF2087 domain-containing protein [Loktanella sp. D2R18]
MPRQLQQITINDLSAFTKSLRVALQQQEDFPNHARMLSLVAKAAGYENYQQLKADAPAPATAKPPRSVERALRAFDHGMMTRWPKQTVVQGLCLWVFWAHLPANQDLAEKQVNEVLKAGHSFGDHVLLRRSLIDHRLVTRTKDGKIYRRIEQAPPAEALAVLAAVQRPL